MLQEIHPWLKHKGYLHLTPQIDIVRRQKEIIAKITNKDFIKSYAFFPLIHSSIKERKYKKTPYDKRRAHSYKDDNGQPHLNSKERPLHYASHMDALIFGYYASLLQTKYEELLSQNINLSSCVIAYRKIPTGIDDKNKSTIHFAKEVFDKIKQYAPAECSVLMFDIKSFFSRINHEVLELAWAKLLGVENLPGDHKNVFNATTKFSYILLDDLREANQENRKSGFDEKHLSEVRKVGKHCFFETPKEFRDKVKSKQITIYRSPFTEKKKRVGIPQGLAISAILANLCLLEFDKKILDMVVRHHGGFYRRYSDDILIICKPDSVSEIKKFVELEIEASKLEISKEKTEEYIFKELQVGNKKKLTSIKIKGHNFHIGCPLTYLGFEFYGDKTLIKSSNLAKFYRRMKYSIKSKAKRAKQLSEESPDNKYAVFRRQLYKLYTIQDLNKTTVRKTVNKLVKNEKGYYQLKIIKLNKPIKSNYLSYVKRASSIMEDESIQRQIRNHKEIFNKTVQKRLKKKNP